MPNYRAIAVAAARRYGIPPGIFLRQIQQESGFNPRAHSGAGAQGIAQIVPKWHPGVDPYNPAQALDYAARMDANNLRKYGNWRDVLSVYNSGRPFSVGRGISETRNYVSSILGGGSSGAAPALSGAAPPAQTAARSDDQGLRRNVLAQLIAANQLSSHHQPVDYTGLLSSLSALKRGAAPSSATGSAQPAAAGGSAPPPAGGPSLSFLTPLAKQFGLTVTSTTGGHHVPGSYHYRKRAEDYGGNPSQMAALQRYALKHPGEFAEAFYTGPGSAPYYVKDGRVYPVSSLDPSVRSGHRDHVHLAR